MINQISVPTFSAAAYSANEGLNSVTNGVRSFDPSSDRTLGLFTRQLATANAMSGVLQVLQQLLGAIMNIFQSLIGASGTKLAVESAPVDLTAGTSITPESNAAADEDSHCCCSCSCKQKNSAGSMVSDPGSAAMIGNEEFLWKPVSEKDKKLAILIPARYSADVLSVMITNPKGKTIATGKYAGIGNGDRGHYRFGKSGGTYPDGSTVHVRLKDGSEQTLKIADTAKRLVHRM